jgi:hypothetical protein
LRYKDPQVEFASLLAEIEGVFAAKSQALDGPELQILGADWSTCMADAGYPGLEQQYQGRQSFYDASTNTPEVQSLDPADPGTRDSEMLP